jgi:hypothetical protein
VRSKRRSQCARFSVLELSVKLSVLEVMLEDGLSPQPDQKFLFSKRTELLQKFLELCTTSE